MQPTKMTIAELFETQRRYVVPLFQRPYVWEREKQWEPLWDDISNKAMQVFDRDQSGSTTTEIGSHFLGAAVINEIKTFGRQVNARQVIDGQQRLTTLQVLLVAFRDFCGAVDAEEVKQELDRLTRNATRTEKPFEKYKIWPTTSDQSTFERVHTAGSPDALVALYPQEKIKYSQRYKPRPRLVEGYLFFYQAIEEYVLGIFDGDETFAQHVESLDNEQSGRVEALLEALNKYIELVIIELEDRDDPQIIFETLNARGEPLLPSDLIRNYVFLEASNTRENVDALYETYWKPFDLNDSFWQAQERQGRLFRPRIDLFMFHYLTFKTEQDISINQLFQAFRDWWSRAKNGTTAQALLTDLQAYSQLYESFFRSHAESRLGTFVRRLQAMDTSTVYPLLLFLYGQQTNLAREQREGILDDVESYLVRRMLCRMTAQNYNRFFLGLLRTLRKAPQVTREVAQTYLTESKAPAARFPTDEEFQQFWRVPVYGYITQNRVAMVLTAIDLKLETGKQEKMHIDEALTIEHVRPQNPSSELEWERVDNDEIVHTFGNLTLLTTKLNSSVSNSAFAYKRPEITKQSRLRLNTYFQDYADADAWTVDEINKRTDRLFQIACSIWPYPGVTVAEPSKQPDFTAVIRASITPFASTTQPHSVAEMTPDPAPVTANATDDAIYTHLQQVARNETVTTYQEVAYMADLTMENPAHRQELSAMLGAISEYEHQHGRPLLSVVVVYSEDGKPGLGFFDLAHELRLFDGHTDSERTEFFVRELKAVYEYWASTAED